MLKELFEIIWIKVGNRRVDLEKKYKGDVHW